MPSQKDQIPSFDSALRERDERLAAALTQVSQMEEQLRQSQKLEAIGLLAGGIAHDFNNLLVVIAGYSELVLRRLPQDSSFRSNVEEIKKAGDRAASLTRQLLAFSRKQILQPKLLDLNRIVSDIERMMRRLIGEDIDLSTGLASRLGRIEADPSQIEQVIINLVVNAREAMPTGGELTILTENIFLDQTDIPVASGSYVVLTVADNGCGMDKETESKIFEPFFTTKATGKGTGLGLSTVYGIVKQSGGSILVSSEPGKGTAFKIYFPMANDGAQQPQGLEGGNTIPQGCGTILLVEDEEVVRRITKEFLEEGGYRVLEADGGAAALSLCKEYGDPIDLLLTDVVMPLMSGRELAEQLAPTRQEMHVLYMSGYTDDAIVRHGLLHNREAFLQKPFSSAALLSSVHSVISEGQRRMGIAQPGTDHAETPPAKSLQASQHSDPSQMEISNSPAEGTAGGEPSESDLPLPEVVDSTSWGRVLIVDDDLLVLNQLKSVVRSMGCAVATASSGSEALEVVEQFGPDIAVVDYQMEGMNGVQTMDALREKVPDILSIMITGFPDVKAATGAIQQSAFDFLTKPFSMSDLKQCLWRAIAFRESRERERRQDDFLSTVSHQLNAPLQLPIHYIGVLLDESFGPLLEPQRDFLQRALDGVNMSVDTIKNLVNSRLLEDGRFAVFPVPASLRETIQLVVDTYKIRANEKDIKLVWSPPVDEFFLCVDKEHVRQAIGNLIANAIDHTPSGGSVHIRLWRSNGTVRCEVMDDGCGIDPKYFDLVFTKSYQVVSREGRRKQGLGFGLYVAREIIRAHDGNIHLESRISLGSTFTVVLPDGLVTEENDSGCNDPGGR